MRQAVLCTTKTNRKHVKNDDVASQKKKIDG